MCVLAGRVMASLVKTSSGLTPRARMYSLMRSILLVLFLDRTESPALE